MVGSIIVVFSPEINSRHMMALAVKLARGERSELLAVYVIEVPLHAAARRRDAATRSAPRSTRSARPKRLRNSSDVTLRTEIIKARSTKQAVLDIAKREKADLIILGSYREGKYSGAPARPHDRGNRRRRKMRRAHRRRREARNVTRRRAELATEDSCRLSTFAFIRSARCGRGHFCARTASQRAARAANTAPAIAAFDAGVRRDQRLHVHAARRTKSKGSATQDRVYQLLSS